MINLVKLERICGAPGISSFEQEIGRILEEEYTSLGFACEKDRLGSVVADNR